MKLLLDTHALLWWLGDDEALGPQARELIGEPDNDVLVSVVSLWEIAVKVRIGKLAVDIENVADAIRRDGIGLLDIRTRHLAALSGLPKHPDHRDPFDHLLIAQAITENATFVSEDRHTPRYTVRFITCSDPPHPLR